MPAENIGENACRFDDPAGPAENPEIVELSTQRFASSGSPVRCSLIW
jgi:hypothetical protein